ncbi:hypothetical protein RLEG3_13790 [Rhizobium leguminosarum bv. trifolii WSM1689]|nr:hypothetical protein RLEG3_13790 [Rhizobium leguminosarum bv. trifolii WSM1689]
MLSFRLFRLGLSLRYRIGIFRKMCVDSYAHNVTDAQLVDQILELSNLVLNFIGIRVVEPNDDPGRIVDFVVLQDMIEVIDNIFGRCLDTSASRNRPIEFLSIHNLFVVIESKQTLYPKYPMNDFMILKRIRTHAHIGVIMEGTPPFQACQEIDEKSPINRLMRTEVIGDGRSTHFLVSSRT